MGRRLPALLLALLLLTGCSSLPEEAEEPEEAMDWNLYQSQVGPEKPAEEPEEPEHPAVFSMAYYKDSPFDPIICGEGVQQDVASLLYEPLFQLNGKFQPEPVLCESYAWDETGRICTLTLRQGVSFHDGSPLTARDAAATLQRAAASDRYGYRLRGMASAAASRSGDLVITLSAPNQGFLSLLDIPIAKSGAERQLIPVGTGPYLFISGAEGDYLQANGEWWQGKPLPVQTIPLVDTKDRDTARYLFSSRQIELLTVDPTDSMASATGQRQTASRATSILQYIGFNTASPVFGDPAVREAFSRGVPRGSTAEAQLAGMALDAQFPVSPLSDLYPKDLERTYSRDGAMTALTAAGQNTGEEKILTLLVNEEDMFRRTSAQYIAENLTMLDWNITVRTLPWEEYLAALESGDFDLYYGEVRLTADWDLRDLVGTGGALNYGGYSDPVVDGLLANYAAAPDRAASLRQLLAYLQTASPIVPVCFKNYSVLTYPGTAEGVSPSPTSTFYGLENWKIHLSQ